MLTEKTGCLLIVDDEREIREILTEILGAATGAKIETAANGKEALAIIGCQSIDAVLSDIHMPGMDGLDCLARVRSMGLETPFVFLTGFGDKEKMGEALRLGATDFLEKPFQPDVVIEVMKMTLAYGLAIKAAEAEAELLYTSSQIPADHKIRLRKMKQAILLMRWPSKKDSPPSGGIRDAG